MISENIFHKYIIIHHFFDIWTVKLLLFTQSDVSGIAWASYKKILIPLGFVVPVLFITLMLLDNAEPLEGLPTNIFVGIVAGLDLVFFVSFLGFLISTIKTWRKMKRGNQARVAEKKDSAAVIGFRRSWSIFNWLIIIFGALVPILFGVVIVLLILKENELLGITGTVLLIIAGVFVLLWMIAFVTGIVFWRKAGKETVKKIAPILEVSAFEINQNDRKLVLQVNETLRKNTTIDEFVVYMEKTLLKKIVEKYPLPGQEVDSNNSSLMIPLYLGTSKDISSDPDLFTLYMAFAAYQKFGLNPENPGPKNQTKEIWVDFVLNILKKQPARTNAEDIEWVTPKRIFLFNKSPLEYKKIVEGHETIIELGNNVKCIGEASAANQKSYSIDGYTLKRENENGAFQRNAFKFLLNFSNIQSAVTGYHAKGTFPFSNKIDSIKTTYDNIPINENIGEFIGINVAKFFLNDANIASDWNNTEVIEVKPKENIDERGDLIVDWSEGKLSSADFKNNDVILECKGHEPTETVQPTKLFSLLNASLAKAEGQAALSMLNSEKDLGVVTNFFMIGSEPELYMVIDIIIKQN